RVPAVDGQHSPIFQCLVGKSSASVRKLWLTASGGPFRKTPKSEFANITVEKALKHPSWVMGRKITIDSATLFNKGLEMIEARWLFDIEMARVEVVVHPQRVVHSMVEFVNGMLGIEQIAETIGRTMDQHKVVAHPGLEQILEADAWARKVAGK